MILALTPLSAVALFSAAWFARARNKRLMKAHEILENLYPGETDRIEHYIQPETEDFTSDDRSFWLESGGWRGLIRKRHNAVCLVQLCQQLHPSLEVDHDQLRLMYVQAVMMSFYCFCSLLEYGPRIFMWDFPHYCARTATQIYWDMERRTTTLCSMYRPDLLDQLHQIL